MDLASLTFRAEVLRGIRGFFYEHGFLELDTPLLSDALIPESCLEIFKTEYVHPFDDTKNKALFLVPSPEVYMKPIIAEHKKSVFQLSKCFRNCESMGRIHNPEFTMLEYYAVNADYRDAIKLTEALFAYLVQHLHGNELFDTHNVGDYFLQAITELTMDDAFKHYAGFYLSDAQDSASLAKEAAKLGLGNEADLAKERWDDLYERIFVHSVEPALNPDKLIAITDYPSAAACLAKDGKKGRNNFPVKERWEIYARGVELANCYSEERNQDEVNTYFAEEDALKQKSARVPHPPVQDFGKVCAAMPPCTGTAMGIDRLIMLLAGRTGLML